MTAFRIGIAEPGRLLSFSALRVGQEYGVVVALHLDLVFKPDTRHERRTRRIVLRDGFIPVQVPNAVASLDLVDGAGAVLVQSIRLGPDPVEVFRRVPDRIVVDLHLEPGDYRLPGRISWIEGSFTTGALVQFLVSEIKGWSWKAEEHSAVVLRRIKDAELQTQREVRERLSCVVEQAQPAIAIADHLAVHMQHAGAARRRSHQ